ncbi:menaquinone reductase molybdopterin-binding-like subunit QrcB [Desulfonatronovibrio hydrogenovorans]|uniref:menaquinone reductase molybdopterin-binding-like subunit QrcB n=1 Tax=Desulfonatronovibrio hydrogenovorans TaxID=53245 RepID=UPI00048D7B72|nr:menaquinone reductase molybdopterin-binding-like subunit QrcB [Desulfonatronovibrio hydrogenovorans]
MALDRRSFITFVVGGAAGTLFTPVPWKLTDDVSIWTQNWPWIPQLEYGELYTLKSTCKLCPAGCGLDIQTVAGRPVTAKGDPEHPLSQGGVCPLGGCSVQLLYSPARVKGPMKKTGPGRFESISWEEARQMVVEKLSNIKGTNGLALISGDENGTINQVLSGFVASMGGTGFYQMPGDAADADRAWKLMNGQGRIGYDLENSDYVLMLGADVLSSWGTVVRNQKAFGAKTGKYVYAGPIQTGSAAVSDQWVPVRPGQEQSLALGICYHLLAEGRGLEAYPGFGAVRRNIMANYDPAKVSAATGLPAEEIRNIAMELLRANKPLVISGSDFGQGSGAMGVASGVLVNMLLGNFNQEGGLVALPESPKVIESALAPEQVAANSLVKLMSDINAGQNVPEAVLVYEANPVYALPQAEQAAKAYEAIPFKVSFSTFMDETAKLSDLVLPNSHYLERLDDAYTPYGSGRMVYSAARPVIDPIFDTKETAEFIFELASQLDISLGFNSLERVMQAKASALGGNWRNISRGEVLSQPARVDQDQLSLPQTLGAAAENGNGEYPLYLAPQAKMRIGNERIAIPPFATVTIKESELSAKGFYVQMNSATAFKHNLRQGQAVTLASEAGTCRALVNITEAVMDDVVAVLMGFGHTAWDEFSQGKGDNVFKLLTVTSERGTDIPVWNRTRVRIA